MAAFRFALQVSQAASPAAWRDLARKAEDLGYSTLYVPDHLDDQWAPMVALRGGGRGHHDPAGRARSCSTTTSAIPSSWPRRRPRSTS